ncbi:hypothetical protein FA95DRAFT_1601754 [Auriscalpium vulgare]|uniref:Uncharacterized protein n=1 Tax=Auriscalpium vulgare TaxID=40419 RepID=A0ACB8S8U5_9AGAM|nr:hypothetical protein FA95DRAFT_1601754 [Auriscalpium vulgare]
MARFHLFFILVASLTSAHAQANAGNMQECDSLTTASQAAQVLSILGIPQPSDPNELVGTRCTQTSIACDDIPPTAQYVVSV